MTRLETREKRELQLAPGRAQGGVHVPQKTAQPQEELPLPNKSEIRIKKQRNISKVYCGFIVWCRMYSLHEVPYPNKQYTWHAQAVVR